jgi:hypothetical protein
MRCNNNTAQLCDSGGKWQEVMNCDKVLPKAVWCCKCNADKKCYCDKVEK